MEQEATFLMREARDLIFMACVQGPKQTGPLLWIQTVLPEEWGLRWLMLGLWPRLGEKPCFGLLTSEPMDPGH